MEAPVVEAVTRVVEAPRAEAERPPTRAGTGRPSSRHAQAPGVIIRPGAVNVHRVPVAGQRLAGGRALPDQQRLAGAVGSIAQASAVVEAHQPVAFGPANPRQ